MKKNLPRAAQRGEAPRGSGCLEKGRTISRCASRPRLMFIVIDQMAGRWVDGVTVEKDFPPVKVWGYHRKDLRGKTLDRAEIVDVAAAIADALDLPYVCEGASILRKAAR